jgi:hypothetical protein
MCVKRTIDVCFTHTRPPAAAERVAFFQIEMADLTSISRVLCLQGDHAGCQGCGKKIGRSKLEAHLMKSKKCCYAILRAERNQPENAKRARTTAFTPSESELTSHLQVIPPDTDSQGE